MHRYGGERAVNGAVARCLLALVLATGCSSDDETSTLGPLRTYPVPGCEHVNHRPCDIREAPCQERLMELAACLRGSEPMAVPPITSMTKAEFADFLNQGLAENPPPDPNHFETALTLLGVLEPGGLSPQARVEDDIEFIWGLYRYTEKDIIIVDHGVPSDEPEPNSVLVHEFVHALQDADVDLARYFEERSTSYDTYLATASVSEGEARLHQSRFWSSLLGLDPSAIDWDEHFRETARYGEEWVLEQASPYTATYGFFPYELGARYVHHVFRDEGLAGVDALFASPPQRAVAVMTSEAAIETADWPAPEFPEPSAPEPWVLFTQTELGAWGSYLHLYRIASPEAARAAATDLRGDRLGVYAIADSRTDTAVVWQLEFGSEASAVAVETLVRRSQGSLARDANRVVLAVVTGGRSVDWALAP